MSVDAHAAGLFGGSLSTAWSIRVDTRRPGLRLAGAPRHGWLRSDTLALAGQTEPGARVAVSAGDAHAAATGGGATAASRSACR